MTTPTHAGIFVGRFDDQDDWSDVRVMQHPTNGGLFAVSPSNHVLSVGMVEWQPATEQPNVTMSDETQDGVLEMISFHFDTRALQCLVVAEVRRRLKALGLPSDHATPRHVAIADASAFAEVPIIPTTATRTED